MGSAARFRLNFEYYYFPALGSLICCEAGKYNHITRTISPKIEVLGRVLGEELLIYDYGF